MSLGIDSQPLPLAVDGGGVVRVGGTRVTLEAVVIAFRQGATAEEIARQFPALAPGDVYSVLGFYLRRREEVDAYVDEAIRQSETARREAGSAAESRAIRDSLLARRSERR